MKTIRPALFLALIAAASCHRSPEPSNPDPPPAADELAVSIASVTLADDCGTGPTAIPDDDADEDHHHKAEARRRPDDARQGAPMMESIMADRACEQSSVQLRVRNGTGAASQVTIQRVELFDDGGQRVGELTPRTPSRWLDDSYQAWDEQVEPSQTLQVSYALSAPSVTAGETYTVRVTVIAGDRERTLERQATLEAEASLPPGVVT